MHADHVYVRSQQYLLVTIAALIFGPIFMIGPLALGILAAILMSFSLLGMAILIATLAASTFIAYHMLQNYHWVELDGNILRGRRFWTRQIVERSVDEIAGIVPLRAMANTAGTAVADHILGPNRGYEFRFKNVRSTIGLVRGDMSNIDELTAAVLEKMRQLAESNEAGADR